MTNLEKFINEINDSDMACANIYKFSKGIAKSIGYAPDDLIQIVKDYNELVNQVKSLKEKIPEKRVIVENLREFVDPELCSEHWDDLIEIFKDDNESGQSLFNELFKYYCGVYDTFKSINNYQDTFYKFGELTTTYDIKGKKVIVTVDGSDCQDIDELKLVFEVYNDE